MLVAGDKNWLVSYMSPKVEHVQLSATCRRFMNINEQSRGRVDVCDDTIIANQKDKIMSEDRKF